jgi:hypothetical protein
MMAMKDGTTTNLEEKRFRVMIDVQPESAHWLTAA